VKWAGGKLFVCAGVNGRLSESFEWPEGLYRRLLEGGWESGTSGKVWVEGGLLVACAGVSGSCLTSSLSPEDSSSLSEGSWGPLG
jgi:hypothetical protein